MHFRFTFAIQLFSFHFLLFSTSKTHFLTRFEILPLPLSSNQLVLNHYHQLSSSSSSSKLVTSRKRRRGPKGLVDLRPTAPIATTTSTVKNRSHSTLHTFNQLQSPEKNTIKKIKSLDLGFVFD